MDGGKQMSSPPIPLSKVTLGTVQLGMRYGISNAKGQPSCSETARLLDAALDAGIRSFDTARAYGTSEERLGRLLAPKQQQRTSIITKLAPLQTNQKDERRAAVRASISKSQEALRRTVLDCVLVHRQHELHCDAVKGELERAQDAGDIRCFGASVYDLADTIEIIRNAEGCRALQLPLSIADQRFADAGVLELAKERGIIVFARSTLLQGALMMAPSELPDYLKDLSEPLRRLDNLANEAGTSRLRILLSSIDTMPGISSIVLGAERHEQVREFGSYLKSSAVSEDLLVEARNLFRGLPENCIDVRQWRR